MNQDEDSLFFRITCEVVLGAILVAIVALVIDGTLQ